MAISHVKNLTVADGTNSGIVRPSDWNSAHNLTYALSGATLGSANLSGADVTLAGTNLTLSADTANSVLWFSVAAQTNQSLGIYGLGNTTQISSGTFDARSLSFSALGEMTVGFSGGVINLSSPVQSFGMSNIGNTLGTSGTFSGQVILAGAGGISLSQSTDVSGNGTLSISYPASALMSYLNVRDSNSGASVASNPGQSSLAVDHFVVPQALSFCQVRFLGSFSNVRSYTAATGSTGSRRNSWARTESLCLYTMGSGANSTAIFSMASSSWSMGFSETFSVSITGSSLQGSITQAIGVITNVGSGGLMTTSGFTASGSSSTNSTNATSLSISNPFSGSLNSAAIMPMGWATSLTPGNYWLGRIAITSATTSGTSSALATLSNIYNQAAITAPKFLGQTATATSMTYEPFVGTYTAQTSGWPTKIASGDVSAASYLYPIFQMLNMSM